MGDRTAAMDFFNNSDEGKMARNLGLSVEDLQEVFDQFDTDGSGGIDSKEFGTLLASLDIVWDDAKIETTVKEIDTDENGLIDFKEFITWFLNGGADMEVSVVVCDDEMEYGSPEWQALHGDYEWDYEKDDDGNYQAQDEFHAKQRQLQEEYEMKQSEKQEENWQKQEENYQKVEDTRMFKAKLMMPLYIKKITKVVEGLTDKPMDACTNSLTVQVGQPEERASVRVYANQTEDWASLNAPANTCSAAVVDFNLRDGYCKESLARVQEIVAAMYAQHVEPMLNKIRTEPQFSLWSSDLYHGVHFGCLLDTNAVLAVDPPLELAMAILKLNANAIVQNAAGATSLNELSLRDVGKTPHARGVDLLATSNLVLGTTKGFESMLAHVLTATDRAQNLTDVDTSDGTIGLTEGTTHTGLETIGTSTRKHLVDTNDVERMHTNTNVESIFTELLV